MKQLYLLVGTVVAMAQINNALASENGEALYKKLCASCHVTSGMPTSAPPIFGVINHVKQSYPSKFEFVEKVVEWVEDPKVENSVMPGRSDVLA